MNKKYIIGCILLLCSSCCRVVEKIEPKIASQIYPYQGSSIVPAFPPLSPEESQTPWGQEYQIGLTFARQTDFYRAITAFKRADILIHDANTSRRAELAYQIFLSYYLGGRYQDVVTSSLHPSLKNLDRYFPTFHDFLLILYESYQKIHAEDKAKELLQIMKLYYPKTVNKMCTAVALLQGDLETLEKVSLENSQPYLKSFVQDYYKKKKSIGAAGLYNAILPGAGYLYVGQTQSAVTALVLNSLFIWSSYHCFTHGHTAAGIILTSFEVGWYFGGIYGAKEAARFYNERLFEKQAARTLQEQRLFPTLMLRYAF